MAKLKILEHSHAVFFCPACDEAHSIPVNMDGATRPESFWEWNQDTDRPTLKPSLLWNVGGWNPMQPICHSFVTDGKIEYLGDSTHGMAGKTVEIPEWKE